MSHYEVILRNGVKAWNKWRLENPTVFPIFNGIDLSGVNLREANLSIANLRGAFLNEANLSEANLSRAFLNEANLSEANLSRAFLIGADLNWANLCGANLSEANLSRAFLIGADLNWANLCGANLYGADLREADLGRADLSGSILRCAHLNRANLSGADLSYAIGNGREVKSLHCFEQIITYTATHIFVGCKSRTIDEWLSITDDELREMSPVAVKHWRKWEPIIKQIITEYPATKQEEA